MERLKNSRFVAGIKQTKNAIISNNAVCIYLADDVSPSLANSVKTLSENNGLEIISGFTRRDLARECNIDVPCAAAAIIKK